MNFQAIWENYRDAIANHYFDTSGRVGRGRFWWFILASIVVSILLGIVGGILGLPLSELYSLAVLLPTMGLAVRRLQDIGRDGKLVWLWVILSAVTEIMSIVKDHALFLRHLLSVLLTPGLVLGGLLVFGLTVVLIVFCCQPGTPGPNAYGDVPPPFDPLKPVPSVP